MQNSAIPSRFGVETASARVVCQPSSSIRRAIGQRMARVESSPAMLQAASGTVIPADVAVRNIEELRIAAIAAEVDSMPLEPSDGDRLVGRDLHLAYGIDDESEHHAAPRSLDSAARLPGSVRVIAEPQVRQT